MHAVRAQAGSASRAAFPAVRAALAAQNDTHRKELGAPVDTPEIDQLKADIAEAEAGIKRMEAENAGLSEQLEAIKAANAKLLESKAKLAEIEATDVPRQRHAISLYANISNIRWDYSDESKVKGYMSGAGGTGGIRSFELDPATQSENFIVNYLWDKMGA